MTDKVTGGIAAGLFAQMKSTDVGRMGLASGLASTGALTPKAAADITSRLVSMQDLSAAKGIAAQFKGKPIGLAAQALADGLQMKFDKQSVFEKAAATVLDIGGGSQAQMALNAMRALR